MTPEQTELVVAHIPFARKWVARRWAWWDEAEGHALEILCKAAVTFDPERGCAFTSYLFSRLRFGMVDEYRSNGARRRLRQLGISVTSLDRVPPNVVDRAVGVDDEYGVLDREAVRVLLDRLNLGERDSRLVELVGAGWTQERIGAELGVHQVRVSQLCKALGERSQRIAA